MCVTRRVVQLNERGTETLCIGTLNETDYLTLSSL